MIETTSIDSMVPGFRAAKHGGTMTLQLELVDCGKCPKAHGPYWYAYQRVGSRLFKVYVGLRRDDDKARAKMQIAVQRSRS